MRNPYKTKHFHSHLENEMLKNQKILKIGPHSAIKVLVYSAYYELQSILEITLSDFCGWS